MTDRAIGILEKAIESNPEKMPSVCMLIRNKFKLFAENFCKEKEYSFTFYLMN